MNPTDFNDREKRLIVAAFNQNGGNGFDADKAAKDAGFSEQEGTDLTNILDDKGVFTGLTYGGGAMFTAEGRELARQIVAAMRPPSAGVQQIFAPQPIPPQKKPPVLKRIVTQPNARPRGAGQLTVTNPAARPSPKPAPSSVVPKEVPIPEAFQLKDFDTEEMRYLLLAYQISDSGAFNWRPIGPHLGISHYDTDHRTARFQDMGVLRVLSSEDRRAAFTKPAAEFLKAMILEGKAADCIYWTLEQLDFVAMAAINAVKGINEIIPFDHKRIGYDHTRDYLRRQLIERGLMEATGPNNEKTKFTPAGLWQLWVACTKRDEPLFGVYRTPQLVSVKKWLDLNNHLEQFRKITEGIGGWLDNLAAPTPKVAKLPEPPPPRQVESKVIPSSPSPPKAPTPVAIPPVQPVPPEPQPSIDAQHIANAFREGTKPKPKHWYTQLWAIVTFILLAFGTLVGAVENWEKLEKYINQWRHPTTAPAPVIPQPPAASPEPTPAPATPAAAPSPSPSHPMKPPDGHKIGL